MLRLKKVLRMEKHVTHEQNYVEKCLFIKLLRSLASVLLVSPITSASLVKTALVSAVGRGADTFFFFCITQKIKETTIHVENF